MIRSHQHPVCIDIASPNLARALPLALLLCLQLPAQAENEGQDAAPQAENATASDKPRAEIDEAARAARIASRRAAAAANKQQKKALEAEAATPTPSKKKTIELAALKDEPEPVKTDWQASLGTTLAGVGIAGFWTGIGVTAPIVQLLATLLSLLLLVVASNLAIKRLSQSKVGRKKVKYAEDHPNSTLMADDAPKSKLQVPPKQTEKPAARTEPSMQAPTRPMNTSARNAAPNTIAPVSRFADTNFAPTTSQQMAARQQALDSAAVSPAERAQKAAAAANAAAKAALGGKIPQEDYGTIPANFNVAGFIRKTRLYFIRLQIAWDKSDIQNISEITTSEICEEFRRQVASRGPSDNVTEVLAFEADVLGVKAVGQKYVVTVKMTGIIKESENTVQEAFEEVWKLSRSMSGKENWLLADIKQY
ncbi:MAG: Tim44 domain-containing protein [Burkholderiales bacterium]|nr:Tim44 domain-containing protein [Burkholderiales bacterium]